MLSERMPMPTLYEAAVSRLANQPGIREIAPHPVVDVRGGDYNAALLHFDWTDDLKVIVNVGDPQRADLDRYVLVAWSHQRGNRWDLTATSFKIFGRFLQLDELPLALTGVVHQAQDRPLSPKESAALSGRPWYIAAVEELKARKGW